MMSSKILKQEYTDIDNTRKKLLEKYNPFMQSFLLTAMIAQNKRNDRRESMYPNYDYSFYNIYNGLTTKGYVQALSIKDQISWMTIKDLKYILKSNNIMAVRCKRHDDFVEFVYQCFKDGRIDRKWLRPYVWNLTSKGQKVVECIYSLYPEEFENPLWNEEKAIWTQFEWKNVREMLYKFLDDCICIATKNLPLQHGFFYLLFALLDKYTSLKFLQEMELLGAIQC